MSNLDKDIYSSLNDEQKSVVIAPLDKHIRIVAGAGSGKTTTILYRIKYLLEKDVDPSSILLTTFNVDAAEVLKDRLKNKLKIDDKILKKMFIGTIDSISYRFYRMYFAQESYRGVQEYSTELLKFLNTDDGKEKILNRFIYVFFDEFQDANNIQFEILKKFSEKSYLTVIGDDAQNIYQWRGSNIDYILNFDKYFPNTVTFKLEKNYRSTPDIIVFANESIKNNQDQIKKSLIPTKNSSGILPLIVKQYSKAQHAEYIVDKIRQYISKGIKLDEIAVLSRNNFGLKNLEEEFEKSKLPYISLISDNDNSKIKVIPNHICLTTIHKAKGLEWDVVFLIDCEDAKFPSEIDPISIEEERRLFYVGITRPKTYLEITFTSNNITRFVGELPSNLYEFPRFNQKYLDYSNKRNVKFETGVVKLISLLESKHIEELRSLKILPDLVNINTKVSSPTILDEYISQYNFNQDYGSFIDRYICRKLNDKKDRDADLVINSLEVNAAQHQIYIKYKANIIHKLDKNNLNSLNNLSKNSKDPEYLIDIDSKDLASLKMICNKIIELCKKYDLEINDVLVLPQSYLPTQFKNKMLDSYKQFKKDKYTMRNIYDISLCSSIRDNRRRLLYRDIFDKFTSNEKIIKNIDKWCEKYTDKNISLKIILNDLDRMIDGEIDMLDLDTNTLIDFKVSSSEIKLDWILQLLTYTSLLRNLKKIQIDTIAIYNPLLGTVISFDVTNWSYENELLDYLIKVRSDKLLKPESNNISTNFKSPINIQHTQTKEEISKNVNLAKKVNLEKKVNLAKKVNLEEEIFDFTQEELEAMIQVDQKMKQQKKITNVEKIRIRPKKKIS